MYETYKDINLWSIKENIKATNRHFPWENRDVVLSREIL